MNDDELNDLAEEVGEVFDDPAKDRERFEANMEILGLLTNYLYEHKGERFNQALLNMDLVRQDEDDFYAEPQDVLQRVQAKLTDLKDAEDDGE